MSGGGGGETTQTTEPWDAVKPYLQSVYERANALGMRGWASGGAPSMGTMPAPGGAGGGAVGGGGFSPSSPYFWLEQSAAGREGRTPNIYGGGMGGGAERRTQAASGLDDSPLSFTAPDYLQYTQDELRAQEMARQLAGRGVPQSLRDTKGYLRDVLAGNYLSPDTNPYLQATYDASTRPLVEQFNTSVLPGLTGQFAAAGRSGSGAHEGVALDATEGLTRQLGDMATNLYGANYARERDTMNRAAAFMPGLDAAIRDIKLGNIDLLSGIGSAERQLLEAQHMEPWRQLELEASLYGAGSPFTSSVTPYYQNRAAGALGGGLSGAGLGAMIGGPVGAGIGGLGGLLLGGML